MIQPCLLRSAVFFQHAPSVNRYKWKTLSHLLRFPAFCKWTSPPAEEWRDDRIEYSEKAASPSPKARWSDSLESDVIESPLPDARMQMLGLASKRVVTRRQGKKQNDFLRSSRDSRRRIIARGWHRFIPRPRFIAGNYANFWEPFDQTLENNYLRLIIEYISVSFVCLIKTKVVEGAEGTILVYDHFRENAKRWWILNPLLFNGIQIIV